MAWSDGGLTTQANGQLACGFHNRWSYAHRHDPPPHDAPPELPDGPDEPSRPGDALARSPVAVASEANRPTAVAGEHSLAVLRRRTRGRLAVADAPDLRFGQGDRVCVVDLVRAVLPLDDDQWRPIAAFLPD